MGDFSRHALRHLIAGPVIILLAGCWASLGNHAIVPGNAAEAVIDQQIRAKLVASLPSLHASKSLCPSEVVLSGTPHPRCEMTIDGQAYPVLAWWDSSSQSFRVSGAYPLVVMSLVEPVAEVIIYHTGRVRCGPPAVRVVPVGGRFTCPVVSGKYAGSLVTLKVMDSYPHVFVFRRKDIPVPPDVAAFDILGARHKKNLPTIADGDAVERLLRDDLRMLLSKSRMHLQKVECPPRLDLSGNRSGYCLAYIDGYSLRTRMWIDKSATYHWYLADELVNWAEAVNMAEAYYRNIALQNGVMEDIQVKCPEHGIQIVHAPKQVPCILITGGKPRTMYALFHRNGTQSYYVPYGDEAPPPDGPGDEP